MSVATHHGRSTASPFSSPSPASVLAPGAPPLCGPPAQPPPPPPAPLQLEQDPPLSEGPTRGGPRTQPPPPPPAPLQLEQGPPLSEGPPRTVPLMVGQSLLPTSVVEQQPAVTSVHSQPPCTYWITDQASSAFCSCPRWPNSGGAVGGGSFAIDLVSGCRSFPVRLLRS